MFAYFVVSLYCMVPALFVCIVMVLWSSSVVSLLYDAIYYSRVSCVRFERVRELVFDAVQLPPANYNYC